MNLSVASGSTYIEQSYSRYVGDLSRLEPANGYQEQEGKFVIARNMRLTHFVLSKGSLRLRRLACEMKLR